MKQYNICIKKIKVNYIIKKPLCRFLEKHPKINCLQRVVRNINDNSFITDILKINCDPSKIKFTSYGNYNQNLNLYFINLNDPMTGFFAFYRNILTALCVADRFSFISVINFEDCPFKEYEIINGTTNPFEYYFKQPGEVSLSELYKSQNIFLFDSASAGRMIENIFDGLDHKLIGGYLLTEEYIKHLASIAAKYIRLNDKTNEYIQTNLTSILYKNEKQQKILGVHIRGTDYALGFGRHPIMVEMELLNDEKNDIYIYIDKKVKNLIVKFSKIFHKN